MSLNHAEVLSAPDIENRATEIADHRSIPVAEIMRRLTAGREALVRWLEVLTQEQLGIVAAHPPLQKAMRLLDRVYFVSEHGDHRLALVRRAIRTLLH